MVRTSRSTCPLDKLRSGGCAEVLELPGTNLADDQLQQRGIRPGARLMMERAAPMGGPVMVAVAGASVAIARVLAHRIVVRPLSEADAG
jgi:Fe2+ transport system protein FeoA